MLEKIIFSVYRYMIEFVGYNNTRRNKMTSKLQSRIPDFVPEAPEAFEEKSHKYIRKNGITRIYT